MNQDIGRAIVFSMPVVSAAVSLILISLDTTRSSNTVDRKIHYNMIAVYCLMILFWSGLVMHSIARDTFIAYLPVFFSSFACVVLTAFLVMFAWGESFFERNEQLKDFTCYDNFIWPVVMQDPLPFDEKTPPESSAVISASIWNCAMDNKNNENKFDFLNNKLLQKEKKILKNK